MECHSLDRFVSHWIAGPRGFGNVTAENPVCSKPHWTVADSRRRPRFRLEVDVTINSRTCGELMGRNVDISDSGVAAMLSVAARWGEVVESDFMLPDGPVMKRAMARPRNAPLWFRVR